MFISSSPEFITTSKTGVSIAGATGTQTTNIFTVNGPVIIRAISYTMTTAVVGGATSTFTLQTLMTPTGGSARAITGVSATNNGTSAWEIGDTAVLSDITGTLVTKTFTVGFCFDSGMAYPLVVGESGTITLSVVRAGNSLSAGVLRCDILFQPYSSSPGSITAA